MQNTAISTDIGYIDSSLFNTKPDSVEHVLPLRTSITTSSTSVLCLAVTMCCVEYFFPVLCWDWLQIIVCMRWFSEWHFTHVLTVYGFWLSKWFAKSWCTVFLKLKNQDIFNIIVPINWLDGITLHVAYIILLLNFVVRL